jgi:hypothetical protein
VRPPIIRLMIRMSELDRIDADPGDDRHEVGIMMTMI